MTIKYRHELTDEEMNKASEIMKSRGIPSDSWTLYGVKHGLLPVEWAADLADTYEMGCVNCRNTYLPPEERFE